MSTMQIPGFTAEASLYTTEGRSRRAYFSPSVAASGKVLPQFCFTNGRETSCCYCYGGSCHCKTLIHPVLE